MKRFFRSLTFKIGIFIILVEVIILTIVGFVYIGQFNNQIDQRIKAQVELPGKLINTRLLNSAAVASRSTFNALVGEELIDSMMVRFDGSVDYTLNTSNQNKNITEIPGINPQWFNKENPQSIYEITPDGVVSVTPVRAILGADNSNSFFIYVKASTAQTERQKREIAVQFAFASLATVVLTSISIMILFHFLISKRVNQLLEVLRRVTSGDLEARIKDSIWLDEIGVMQTDVNNMANQLQQTIQTLEKQVFERTRGLETVVEISRQVVGILELGDLLHQMVILTKETFNYYHVHIYLLEEDKLVLTEGYGQAGEEMKRQGHTIPLNAPQSLVARAARQGTIVNVADTINDPTWLPNPLLPATHAEMAIPIMSHQQVIGVLDVQSEKVNGLTAQDEILLLALANQVAVAVRNARAFQQTQEALNEAQHLQQLYTGRAWEKFSTLQLITDYEVRRPSLPPLQEIDTPEVALALKDKRRVDWRIGNGNQPAGAEVMMGEPWVASSEPTSAEPAISFLDQAAHGEQALAIPLKVGEEIIGVLGIRDDQPGRRWTDEELALIDAVSEQMSLAIENARLFEETGRRAGREKLIADVTREIWASGELEQVMRTTVEQLGVTLNASRVVLRLGTEEQFVTVSTPANDDSAQEYDPDSINFDIGENQL